jgi:2-polyprenyl-6-methoxyphenol hydroxylase-like FAD-dependent oxidoreductase
MSEPANLMSQQPIIILGSGIGGLTLGRCLRQKGIPSLIYEKATSSPRHGFGITLHDWAYKPLLQVLNIDEHSFRRRTAVDSLYRGGTGKLYPNGTNSTSDHEPRGSFRANRSKLESLLREGQDINWEHVLGDAKPTQDSDRFGTNLIFQDDQQLHSSFTIDTLGVHSQLRKSLLPTSNPTILPYVVFSGKCNITPSEFSTLYAPSLKDGNILKLKRPMQGQDVLLQIWINDHLPSGDISISYVYSRAARSTDPEHPDPLHNPERPPSGAADIPDAFYDELQELFGAGSDIKEPFISAFDPATIRRERLLHWLMRTILVEEGDLNKLYAENGVVMIGDSCHATPILGGNGANYVIQDAVELAEVIAGSAGGGGGGAQPGQEAIRAFYSNCAERWREGVEKSERGIAKMHGGQEAVLLAGGMRARLPCGSGHDFTVLEAVHYWKQMPAL